MKTEELTIYSDLKLWREENGLTDNNWETFAKLSGKRIRFMFWAGWIIGTIWIVVYIYLILPFLAGLIK